MTHRSHLFHPPAAVPVAASLRRAEPAFLPTLFDRLQDDEPTSAHESPDAYAPGRERMREGLTQTLAHYFGVPVALREYELRWIPVEKQDRCCLANARTSSVLGHGAVIGSVVPDRQAHFRLLIGPLDLQRYLRFTPGRSADGARGRDLAALVEWVRAFVGFEYAWDVELHVVQHEVPTARLGGAQQLGWSSWLAGNPSGRGTARRGMTFDPEDYLARSRPIL